MTGLPGSQILLDDGSGAFPYDVTTYARLKEGLAWSRGRSDENAENQPGRLQLVFDNTDGRFTLNGTSKFGRRNLATNPSFENNLTDWSTNAATQTRDTTWAASGSASVKVTPDGSANNDCFTAIGVTLTRGVTYTISATVRLTAAQTSGSLISNARGIRVFPLDFAYMADSNVAPNAAGVTRVSVTFTVPATGSNSFQVRLYNGSPLATDLVWWDAVMIEEAATSLLPYFDGDTAGAAWTGTAGNSTSTKPYGIANDLGIRYVETVPASQAACNLFTDSSFDVDMGCYIPNTGTQTIDSSQAKFGSASLNVSAPGSENYGYFGMNGDFGTAASQPNHTVGATYTASVWVRSTTNQSLMLTDYGDSNTHGPTVNVIAGVWTRLYVTFVAGTNVYLSVRDPGRVRTVDPFWLDAVMCTAGSTLYDWTAATTPQSFTRWTGKVQDWPVTWPGGDDVFCTVAATGVDALAALGRQQLLGSSDQEILRDSPAAYYPLQEQSSALSGSDVSGNNRPALLTGTAATKILAKFGTTTGLPDGSTGAGWSGDGTKAAQDLASNAKTLGASTGAAISATWALVSTVPNGSATQVESDLCQVGANNLKVNVDHSTTPTFISVIVNGGVALSLAVAVNDGNPHVLTAQVDGTSTDLWVDGAKSTAAGQTISVTDLQPALRITNTIPANAEIVVSRYAYKFARLTDARVAAWQSAILNDFSGETPSQRIARLFTYVTGGYATGTVDTAGDTILGPAAQSGKSILDAVNDTLDADLGDAYVDANGKLSTIAGASIVGQSVPKATLDAAWAGGDTLVPGDMFGVVNLVTGKGTRQDAQTFVLPAGLTSPSITAHGDYPNSYVWNVSTDAQALDRANWIIATYANPQPRLPSLVLDLLTMDTAIVAALLALDLTSLFQVTGLPAQTPGGTTITTQIEGITETVTDQAWTLTLTLSMKALRSAWILGDATYGVLDSTTKLYI